MELLLVPNDSIMVFWCKKNATGQKPVFEMHEMHLACLFTVLMCLCTQSLIQVCIVAKYSVPHERYMLKASPREVGW